MSSRVLEVSPSRRTEMFRAVFDAELPWLYATLRRLGVRPSDLEDVAHDVLLSVYKKLDAYEERRPMRPWLFAFAYRTASDYRRLSRHREQPTDEIPEAPTSAPAVDELLARREEASLVHAALDAIDLERRALLVGFEMDGVPMKDLAAAMGIPLNTAYSRLRLAREDFTAAVRRLQAKRAHATATREGGAT